MKYSDGSYFRDTNPFSIARELGRLRIGTITVNPIRSGSLLMKTKTKSSARILVAREEFLGRDVCVEIADRLNTVEAVACAPSLKTL